ncbi:MAG: sigma-70 family RNA polymerase sigma factor [Rhizobacter sp.]
MDEMPVAADAVEARLASRIASAAPAHDNEAEAALYRLLAPRIRRYGQRHLRDDHAAADLMQHVMALTLEQLRQGRVREPERIVSFVFGTCRMTLTDMRRRGRRREELLEQHAELLTIADVAVAPRLDHERVADCLERLPERERSLLVLTFYEDKRADEVAGELGLSTGNVRVVRHRAIAKMRSCVDGGARPPKIEMKRGQRGAIQ